MHRRRSDLEAAVLLCIPNIFIIWNGYFHSNNEMRRQKVNPSRSSSSIHRLQWVPGIWPEPLAVPFSAHALRMAAASQSECRHQASMMLPRPDGGRKFTRVLNTRLPRTALASRRPALKRSLLAAFMWRGKRRRRRRLVLFLK